MEVMALEVQSAVEFGDGAHFHQILLKIINKFQKRIKSNICEGAIALRNMRNPALESFEHIKYSFPSIPVSHKKKIEIWSPEGYQSL